jgi:hypothetical protein
MPKKPRTVAAATTQTDALPSGHVSMTLTASEAALIKKLRQKEPAESISVSADNKPAFTRIFFPELDGFACELDGQFFFEFAELADHLRRHHSASYSARTLKNFESMFK